MSYKTRLNPPPANGWTPPPLPPLEEMLQSDLAGKTSSTKSRQPKASPPGDTAKAPRAPRMKNLFEEASTSLFDGTEDAEGEFDPVIEAPAPIGNVVINGEPAQLLQRTTIDGGRTQFKVILDATGETKTFVSPPAVVSD